jgi:hypothetical protein
VRDPLAVPPVRFLGWRLLPIPPWPARDLHGCSKCLAMPRLAGGGGLGSDEDYGARRSEPRWTSTVSCTGPQDYGVKRSEIGRMESRVRSLGGTCRSQWALRASRHEHSNAAYHRRRTPRGVRRDSARPVARNLSPELGIGATLRFFTRPGARALSFVRIDLFEAFGRLGRQRCSVSSLQVFRCSSS